MRCHCGVTENILTFWIVSVVIGMYESFSTISHKIRL